MTLHRALRHFCLPQTITPPSSAPPPDSPCCSVPRSARRSARACKPRSRRRFASHARLILAFGDKAHITFARVTFAGAELGEQKVDVEPGRRWRFADGGAVARPWPLAGGFHHGGAHRVQH